MSYILDALKKSQTQQNDEGVAVRLTPAPQKQGVPTVWVAVLATALVINIGILGWYVLGQDDVDTVASSVKPPAAAAADQQIPHTPAAQPAQSSAAGTSQTSEPPTDTATATASQPTPTRPRPVMPVRVPQAPDSSVQNNNPSPTDSRPATNLQRVKLTELPAVERTLYDGFSFTSHIFTDDPDLRAVVIDGERLQTGDAFKGLKVIAITETGVVFEENRRGKRRQVVVNPFE